MSSKMDPRCPRGLKQCPKTFCPLAVQRLKAIKYSNKDLTEEEEAALPGCGWAISSQMHNYCFFSYISEERDTPLSDVEIAHLTGTSVADVKVAEKAALEKLKKDEAFVEIKELYTGSSILSEFDD